MPKGEWAFITNHGATLALIARHGQVTALEIAAELGITERPVRRIISELVESGYIVKTRVGRVNHYKVKEHLPMVHPVARDVAVGSLLAALNVQNGDSTEQNDLAEGDEPVTPIPMPSVSPAPDAPV